MRASRAHCHVVIVRNFVEALAGIADAPVPVSGVLQGALLGTPEVLKSTQGATHGVLAGYSRRTHGILTQKLWHTHTVLVGSSRGTHGVLTGTIRSGPDRAHPLVYI